MLEIRNILEREGIEYYEMNKLDFNYTRILGELQIFVSEVDGKKVQQLLKNIETE